MNKKYVLSEPPIRRTTKTSKPRISQLCCRGILNLDEGGLSIAGGGCVGGRLGVAGVTTAPEIGPEEEKGVRGLLLAAG